MVSYANDVGEAAYITKHAYNYYDLGSAVSPFVHEFLIEETLHLRLERHSNAPKCTV